MSGTIIDLPFPPSANNLFATKGRRRIRSERYISWTNVASAALLKQKPKRVRGPVALTILVENKTDRLRDLGNLEKAVTDLLVDYRIIDGDNYKTVRAINLAWSSSVCGCRVAIARAEAA